MFSFYSIQQPLHLLEFLPGRLTTSQSLQNQCLYGTAKGAMHEVSQQLPLGVLAYAGFVLAGF